MSIYMKIPCPLERPQIEAPRSDAIFIVDEILYCQWCPCQIGYSENTTKKLQEQKSEVSLEIQFRMAGVVDKVKQVYKREWQNERAREANKV